MKPRGKEQASPGPDSGSKLNGQKPKDLNVTLTTSASGTAHLHIDPLDGDLALSLCPPSSLVYHINDPVKSYACNHPSKALLAARNRSYIVR